MDDYEDYENDDVEQVFQAREAQRHQDHQEQIASFWRDLMRLDHLDLYVDSQWDISKMPEERRAKVPKEPAIELPREDDDE